jgi:acrylyl-CoA reductase (NADPH)
MLDEAPGGVAAHLLELDDEALPDGAVIVDVAYSSINYKDALAVRGAARIARTLPLVAGIDLAGTVRTSTDDRVSPGDHVVATGCGLGESRWGGFAQRASLDGEDVLALPYALSPHQAMQLGTAGVTAMLCVLALEDRGLRPGEGPVLVTGAAGGVGSFAIAILARLGHEVVASTGRREEAAYLHGLGAAEIVDRAELAAPGKLLGKERWAAAVDTVGGQTLANVCATLRSGAAVAACGNVGGMDFPASVAPFILRGVSLIGIDSVRVPRSRRLEVWKRLSGDLDPAVLDTVAHDVGLTEVVDVAQRILDGEVRGRLVVDVGR